MKVVYNADEMNNDYKGVGLGNFDGLHIGHFALINTLIHESRFNGYSSLIYTFTKHPENILRKKLFKPLLTTKEKKIELLSDTALDYLYFEEFDEEFSRLTPFEFARDILVGKLNVKLVVAGFNYRFGYKGQGNSELLRALGHQFDFRVIIIPPVRIEKNIASSTLIRANVIKGNMDIVFKLLGRHYSIDGTVRSGQQLAGKLGFPTANISPREYIALPHNGVYITKTLIDGKLYESITNVGTKPTVGQGNPVSLETHIFDFNKDIYNRKIEVFFISKIRNEKIFSGMDELVQHVKKDIVLAKESHRKI